MLEYKTELLSGFAPKAEKQINEIAKDGWELVDVSFNIGYFRREKAEKRLYGKE